MQVDLNSIRFIKSMENQKANNKPQKKKGGGQKKKKEKRVNLKLDFFFCIANKQKK